jgi:hypothetical protein
MIRQIDTLNFNGYVLLHDQSNPNPSTYMHKEYYSHMVMRNEAMAVEIGATMNTGIEIPLPNMDKGINGLKIPVLNSGGGLFCRTA